MYYPKSQVKSNLYTNGGEYILSTTNEEYKGYYYKISTGQFYTGKNPQQGPNILLTLLNKEDINNVSLLTIPSQEISIEQNTEYDSLTYQTRSIPLFNPTTPTPQEQQNGQFTRYFCKRNNELKYIEINLDTYTQLSIKDPQIAWDLYTPASVVWQIQGDKNTVYASNQSSVSLVEKIQTWYGFSQYFRGDFLKYYLGS
jgi:hypothetical protein